MAEQELTAEEKTTVVEWLKKAWEYVASDCFLREDGKIDYRREFTREEVFEIAADQIEITLYSKRSKELCMKFHCQSQAVKTELMERSFPNRVYGY